MSGLVKGFVSYIQALQYLFKGWALKYLFLTGLLAITTLIVFGSIVYFKGDDLAHAALNLFNLNLIPWLDIGLEWVVRGVLWVVCILLFKYLILILASPFLSTVSNKVEAALKRGKVFGTREQGFMSSIGRAISVSGGNLINEILLTIPLLIFSFIPGVAIITTPLIFLIQAYYIGYGNIDTYLENKFSTKQSKAFVKRNRGLAIANGSVFLGLLLIPIAGVFLAPMWSIIAITIAGESKLSQQSAV